ncbi:hypothetical protein [Clostridium botulinum]|uniref:hypothetical protein n=1 Tax=Clostridium botulinum TaxID=1491 RepID=UPI001C9A4049|nr:hypothetical protein [Clostridium botulinum]MBY6838797.1 hypothetical protein [Clostridium botulinum]
MNKYYIVNDKGLAIALSYVINEDFFTYDDKHCKDKKVYSFKYTDKFKRALQLLPNLRKDFNK